MAPHWKCGLGVTPSRVRIPLSPPALPARNATFPRFGSVSSSTRWSSWVVIRVELLFEALEGRETGSSLYGHMEYCALRRAK